MASAVAAVEKCLVCDKEYNPLDPLSHPPTCSKKCWWIWIHVTIHAGSPCWIKKEVDCGTKGVWFCDACPFFNEQAKEKKEGGKT